MIEVMGLTKKFKEVTAVDNISFKVNKGEIVGLLGENGAGKTTTLRMISTMLKPNLGTAKICDLDLIKNPDEVRKKIGILFGGEVGLYDRLTARENIKYFADLGGLSNEEANKNIDMLAEMLDMKEYIDRRVGKFSRGMKQKVAIARAIVHNPEVMLFDEPTIGLDVSSSAIVQDFILDCKKRQRAIVFSSHSMREVEKLCDRVVIINKGKLVYDGTVEELKNQNNGEDLERVFLRMVGGKNE